MLVQSLYALTEYKLERARTPRLIMHQDPNQAIQTVLTETRLCRPEPLDTTTPHISSYPSLEARVNRTGISGGPVLLKHRLKRPEWPAKSISATINLAAGHAG